MQNFEYGKFFQSYVCARVVNIYIFYVNSPNSPQLSTNPTFSRLSGHSHTTQAFKPHNKHTTYSTYTIYSTHYIHNTTPCTYTIQPHKSPISPPLHFYHTIIPNPHKTRYNRQIDMITFIINHFSISNTFFNYCLLHSVCVAVPICTSACNKNNK